MKTTYKIVILVLIIATMLMIGCNNGSKNAQIVTPVTEAPTAEVVTQEVTTDVRGNEVTPVETVNVVTPSPEPTHEAKKQPIMVEDSDFFTIDEASKIDNGESFELGNSTGCIIQGGTRLTKGGVDYYAYKDGLYDAKTDHYLTDYQVYNLNYFDEVIYYSVTENGKSRIERYNLKTDEREVLYWHSTEIWEMYCISNDHILFNTVSEEKRKQYRMDLNPVVVKEIAYDLYDANIMSLVPAANGTVLIGGKDWNYSIYAENVLFWDGIYHVYEDSGYLIITRDAQMWQVNVEKLLDYVHEETVKLEQGKIDRIEFSGLIEECNLYEETTMSELFRDSPLWAQENNDADVVTPMQLGNSFITTPTPVVVPYEGIVVGRDVNDNELHMTQEEADRFVLEGNILKLYDGSWFDLDDDGEPEYISIRPYGEWSPGNSQNGEYPYEKYLVNLNGEDVDINRPDVWTDEKLYAVEISGYGIKFMEDSRADDLPWFSNGRTEQRDYCLYIISLDNQTKQVMIRTTMYGPADEMFSQPYVYRLDNKTLKGCGWLGCEVKDFTLEENQIYGAQIILRNVVLGPMVLKEKNHFDGQRIVSEIEGVDLSFYPERLKFIAETMILKIADEEGTITINHGDELELVSIELLNPDSINQYINQTSLEYTEKYFVSGVYATSIEYFEKKLVCRLSFRIPETGEIGYVDEVDGELENCVTDVMGTSTYFYGFGKDP